MESFVFVVPPNGHSNLLHILQQYGVLDDIESQLIEAGRCVLYMKLFFTRHVPGLGEVSILRLFPGP